MKALFFLWMTPLPVLANSTVEFKEIPQLVRENNSEVRASLKLTEAMKAREGSWGRSFLPEVKATVAQENFRLGNENQDKTQSDWGVEAELNLFRGGKDRWEEKLRVEESLAQDLASTSVYQKELQKSYELYWEILYKKEVLKSLNRHLELSNKNLSSVQKRIQSGVALQMDRMDFEMKISVVKQQLGMTEKELRTLQKKLGLQLGRTDAVEVTGSLEHFHDWEKALKPISVKSLTEVKRAQREVSKLEVSKRQWASDYLPRLDIYAVYAEPNQRKERDFDLAADRRETYYGLKASWSLGRVVEAGVERGRLQHELLAKESQLKQTEQRLNIEQVDKLEELKILHSFVHDAETNIDLANKYLTGTLREYGRGVKNSGDVLVATESLINSQIRWAEIIRNFNVLYSEQVALGPAESGS